MRVVGALLLVELLLGTAASAASVSAGRDQYNLNHVAEAERIYAQVVADRTASPDDRSTAERELARVAWLIDGDSKRALGHLDAARGLGGKPCDTAEMTARVLRESKRGAEAESKVGQLEAMCSEPDKLDTIRTHLIGARLDLAQAEPARRVELLRSAAREAEKLTSEAGVEGARVRLELALLTDRPDAALSAWKDYFWLDDSDAPQALQTLGVTSIFTKGLAPNAAAADRLALADLLMRAGFFEQSRRYAMAHGLPGTAATDPGWRKLEAYWRFRDAFDPLIVRVNRALARGDKSAASLAAAAPVLNQAAAEWLPKLVAAAGMTGDPKAILVRAYGLVGSVGTTSGYPSVHLGHVIEDRNDQVTQYGHTAKIHFMALDNMLANGFESWLWDGSAMVGGWSSDDVIVHVRPGYVQSPLRAFRLTQDSPSRRDMLHDQAKKGSEDIAKLKARPVATLEGLNDRLQMQLVDQIWAGARSKGATEADVRRNFLAEYSRANLNQSITVHEGRHAIDATLGLSNKVEQPVLEYRAKLSELALTAYPRMALRNLDTNIEGDGPHDRAGARIFGEFRKWMEAHPDQVMGYDPAIPPLAQLDKLSDGQIREIARSLDPLARGLVTSPAKLSDY
ncbi:MAG: hypothetical protein ACJ8FT_05155 [Sphingomonas sp.]